MKGTSIPVVVFASVVLAACSESGTNPSTDHSDVDEVDASNTADIGEDATDDDAIADVADGSGDTGEPRGPFWELEEAGLAKYLGTVEPAGSSTEGDVTTWEFAVEDGPMCIYGEPFRVSSRARDSRDLLIFMQGGGACWADFCFAIDTAPPGVPPLDVLDVERPTNPFADWNVVYLPYCDGSLFAGDVDIDEGRDGTIDRYHRGLRNLSAALDVARSEFPDVDRIMIAGSSGGGYGTLVAAPLVRIAWPDVELLVFNDAGAGLGKPEEPAFIESIVDEWNIRWAVPASCTDCLVNSHLTPLITWALDRDPELRVALFSSTSDSIIGTLFLQIGAVAFRGRAARAGRAGTGRPSGAICGIYHRRRDPHDAARRSQWFPRARRRRLAARRLDRPRRHRSQRDRRAHGRSVDRADAGQ
jgi:hypothetical protein